MTTDRLRLIAPLLLSLLACKQTEKVPSSNAAETPAAAPAPKERASAAESAPRAGPPGRPLLPAPLTHQTSNRMTRLSFLGWTRDGQRFAVDATHGRDMEELGTRNVLHLRQVHDALTGKMMASFRVARVLERGERSNPSWKKAWEEARPRRAWKAFTKENPLVSAKASRKSPGGEWTLQARPFPAPSDSKFSVKQARDGLRHVWSDFVQGRDSPATGPEPGPRARLLIRGKRRLALMTFQVPHTYDEIASGSWVVDGRPPRVVGAVRPFWSPAGDRVVLVITTDVEGWSEEDPMDSARFYVRTLGPQLRIVAPRAREAAARALARRLAAAGLPVTHLSLDGAARARTLIYHRGKDGAALAKKAAGLISGPVQIKPQKKPGWLRLLVILGAGAFGPLPVNR